MLKVITFLAVSRQFPHVLQAPVVLCIAAVLCALLGLGGVHFRITMLCFLVCGLPIVDHAFSDLATAVFCDERYYHWCGNSRFGEHCSELTGVIWIEGRCCVLHLAVHP